MIWFFTPYSFKKKLFEAYDQYMQLIGDPNDWGCICDGDMAFMMSDFGNHIQEYIDKYPRTGLFICYASRSPYGWQMKPGNNPESDSIKYIFDNTMKMYADDHLKVIEQHQRICAPLLVIQKKTWDKYRGDIAIHARSANIQAVDTAISDILQKNNEKVLLMAGIQVYHYFRQYSRTEKHILSDKLTVVIRTHSRPRMFERCITSVLVQTHKNIEIIVGVDNQESYDYAIQAPARVIRVEPRERTSPKDFPANEYISKLIEDITDGFILVLDDDAYIPDQRGVEKLFSQIDKEWCLYIMRYHHPDGKLFPNDSLFRSKTIQDGGIDWGSFVFHARFARLIKSKPLYNADYHFINELNGFVKTSKWIDLALVHTDTPGMNGKTEKEITKTKPAEVQIQPIETNGQVDIVYVLGSGSDWNDNELRFSLRSIAEYGINAGKVFVVGNCPGFLSGKVIHIPAEDIYNPSVNADGNIAHKVSIACADDRLSEDFLFINDDHILLKPVDLKCIPAFHKGDLNSYDPAYFGLNYWRSRLKKTRDVLNNSGLTAFNFDCHAPMLINKIKFPSVVSKYPVGEGIGLTMKSIYGNSTNPSRYRFLEGQKKVIFQPLTVDKINERLFDCGFMAFNDSGLNKALKIWLYQRFPYRCVYETSDIEDKHIDIMKWLNGTRKYEDGVMLFEKYMRGSNLCAIFKSGESESLRKKLEYKLKQSITE